MLPCVCSVIDHRKRQNMVGTSVTHSPYGSCATFLFLPHFYHVICDLLLNGCTATLPRVKVIHVSLNRTFGNPVIRISLIADKEPIAHA